MAAIARPPSRRRQAGLTLAELMIAIAILGIAITAAFAIGYTMIDSYKESRKVIAVERSTRAALSYLTTAVRAASPGVKTGAIDDAVGCNPWQGISVIDDPDGDDGPDELRVVFGSGRVITSIRDAFNHDSGSLTVVDSSQFRAGDRALVIDPPSRGVLVEVADVPDGETLTLTGEPEDVCPGLTFASPYPARSMVVRAKLAHFYVDDDNVAWGVPMLMFDPDGAGPADPEPIAEGVEDFQVAVGVDADGDGAIHEDGGAVDDDEWYYNVLGDAPPPLATATPWRALRLTVTARSLTTTSSATDSKRPAAENRPEAATGDAYRRRSMSTTVEIRNLEGSP